MTHPYSIDASFLLPLTGTHGAMGEGGGDGFAAVPEYGAVTPLFAGSLRPSTGVLGCVLSECNPRLETTDRDEVDEVRHAV